MNMSQELKAKLLPKLQARYARRNREGKSRMLDELCEDHGYDRKYALTLLGDLLPAARGRRHPGPEPQYEILEPIVAQLGLASEQPCGKRLAPLLQPWLPYDEKRVGQRSGRQRKRLEQIRAATLDRRRAGGRAEHPGRGRGGTKPGRLLKTQIPIRTGSWDLTRPGYVEADRVAHCGASRSGEFIGSRTDPDIDRGGTEGRAVGKKGAAGVLAATQEVEAGLPFALLGFDCDHGSEFLNHHLWG